MRSVGGKWTQLTSSLKNSAVHTLNAKIRPLTPKRKPALKNYSKAKFVYFKSKTNISARSQFYQATLDRHAVFNLQKEKVNEFFESLNDYDPQDDILVSEAIPSMIRQSW